MGWGSWLARELGLRFMARRKAASLVAVSTLALALAVNTAAFSVVRAFLRSRFGLPDADRVLIVAPVRDLPGRGEIVFADAYPNYLLLRASQRSFDEVAAIVQGVSSWNAEGEARTVRAARVTASFFAT